MVIFRRLNNNNGGSIIALFPEIPADINGIYVMSYGHVGQHGAANYESVIARSTPIEVEEYTELKTELESIGYSITVYRRQTANMRKNFIAAVRSWKR